MLLYFEQPFPDRKARLISELAEFTLGRFFTPARLKDITINFELVSQVKGSDSAAYCSIDIPLREFTIELDRSMNMRILLLGVAHELIHVKQYLTGQMYEGNDDNHQYRTFWAGNIVNEDKWSAYDAPWEVEAYGMELGILYRWLDASGYLGKYDWADAHLSHRSNLRQLKDAIESYINFETTSETRSLDAIRKDIEVLIKTIK